MTIYNSIATLLKQKIVKNVVTLEFCVHVTSSYPEEFRRIPRQSDFHIFRGDGCPVTPGYEIIY